GRKVCPRHELDRKWRSLPDTLLPKMVSSGSMVARANEGFIYWGEEHPKTYLLAHNAVHALIANRMNGDAGFMAMWISPRKVREENWATCFCGWRPDLGTHYRHRKDSGHRRVGPVTPSGLIYGKGRKTAGRPVKRSLPRCW